MINIRLKPAAGGVLAFDRNGIYIINYMSECMFQNVANSDSFFQIKILQ
jgi:hypothetical protein